MLHHIRRRRLPPRSKLVRVVKKRDPATDRLSLVAGGWYGSSLRPYHRRFGDRLLILLYDDLEKNPAGVYRRALLHIGADPTFQPEGLESVVFSNRTRSDGDYELTLKERRIMYEYFRDDIRRLQKIMGRKLRMWDPDHAPRAKPAMAPDEAPQPEAEAS
jgi:hypothetical protein